MEVVVNKYIINSVLNDAKKENNKSLDYLDKIIKNNNYRNIVLLIIDNMDINTLDKNSFLMKNLYKDKLKKYNTKINIKEIVKDINTTTENKAYGIFKDNKKGYKNLDSLCIQISSLTEINNKKYIFSYIENEDTNLLNKSINKLSRMVKSTIIIIIDSNNNLVLINKTIEEKDYIIRRTVVRDFTQVKKLVFPHQQDLRSKRRDIFSASKPYTLQEFSQMCIKHPSSYALVYERNNEILGFIEAKLETPASIELTYEYNTVLTIRKLVVKKEYRRNKIATNLYKEIEKYAKKMRAARIEARVYYFDDETIKFLESINLSIQNKTYEKKLK